MPSKDSYTTCKCQPCCESSGGNGRRLTTSQHCIHMAAMRTSAVRSTPVAHSSSIPPSQSNPFSTSRARYPLPNAQVEITAQAMSEHISSVPTYLYADLLDQVSTETFVSTLHDEGIDPTTQPDKLWTSRVEFQQMSSGPSPTSGLPSIGAVTQGMERLSLQTHISPSTPTSSPPTSQRASPPHLFSPLEATPRPSHRFAHTPPSTPTPSPPTPQRASSLRTPPSLRVTPPRPSHHFTPTQASPGHGESHKSAKKESNHHTTKALKNLDAIEEEVQKLQSELVEVQSLNVIVSTECTVESLLSSLASVNRDVPSVKARKAAVADQLSFLQDSLRKLRLDGNFADPIRFSSSRSCFLELRHAFC